MILENKLTMGHARTLSKLDDDNEIRDKKLTISFVNNADLNRILEILDIKE